MIYPGSLIQKVEYKSKSDLFQQSLSNWTLTYYADNIDVSAIISLKMQDIKIFNAKIIPAVVLSVYLDEYFFKMHLLSKEMKLIYIEGCSMALETFLR